MNARPSTPRWLPYPNLVVRCSAYHFGDFAPGAYTELNAVGTSGVFKDDIQYPEDPRFDQGCPVYARDAELEAHSCPTAIDPITKKQGCRMCWRNPEIRVNFVAH